MMDGKCSIGRPRENMKDEMVKKLHIRDEMLMETKEKGCGGHDCKKFMTASDTGLNDHGAPL